MTRKKQSKERPGRKKTKFGKMVTFFMRHEAINQLNLLAEESTKVAVIEHLIAVAYKARFSNWAAEDKKATELLGNEAPAAVKEEEKDKGGNSLFNK